MNGQTIDFEKQTNVGILLGKNTNMHMQPAQTFCSFELHVCACSSDVGT